MGQLEDVPRPAGSRNGWESWSQLELAVLLDQRGSREGDPGSSKTQDGRAAASRMGKRGHWRSVLHPHGFLLELEPELLPDQLVSPS